MPEAPMGVATPVRAKYLERAVNDGVTGASQNTTEIEMLEAKEAWSVYRLSDGTTLRIKPVMIAVFRADGDSIRFYRSTSLDERLATRYERGRDVHNDGRGFDRGDQLKSGCSLANLD